MRTILLLIFIALTLPSFGQDKWFTKTGHIDFYSHTPMEDIKAVNEQVTSFLDVSTGEMVFAVLIKSFDFEKALMEEHFNENYVESDKFPKSSFKGQIVNLKDIDFSATKTYQVIVKGELAIHGVNREMEASGTLDIKQKNITAKSAFTVKPEDYDITIPGAVRNKIAQEMQVNVEMNYEPYTK